jgi:hypothetical protein
MAHAACCPLRVACLFVVRCMLLEVWRMLSRCCALRVACLLLFAACCLRSGACCLDVACCTLSVTTHFPVVVCGIAVRWILSACPFSVAFHSFSVACFRMPAPVPHVAWGALCVAWSHVASLLVHVLRCESSVACCMLHVPSRIVSLVCCLSHLACRHTITLATCTHARTHARTHAHLGLQQVSPATVALNCERRRGYSRARG